MDADLRLSLMAAFARGRLNMRLSEVGCDPGRRAAAAEATVFEVVEFFECGVKEAWRVIKMAGHGGK